MKTILFCNSQERQCGVYQYGRNLFDSLATSKKFNFVYLENGECAQHMPAAVIYNWHPDMGGWMAQAPFADLKAKQILVYHDWQPDTSKFDAVIFSDPTMEDHDNWHSIPRPLPQWIPGSPLIGRNANDPIIGVHGFYGATANLVVEQVAKEFESAVIRLHLPFAHYGDQDGAKAREMVHLCMKLLDEHPKICLTYSHQWLDTNALLGWLSYNDMNCYLRDTKAEWKGVSSALDAALAVRRPLAINKCQGFRHVFACEPSICVEDRSLKEILATGIEPLKPLYEQNSREKLLARMEQILEAIEVHAD